MSLPVIVDTAMALLESRLTEAKIEVERKFAPDLPQVLGRGEQLQHAVLQISVNAIQAMGAGGRLTFELRAIEGELVRLIVTDTGRGIAPHNLDKIFEPFFTTKKTWTGQGLGMTVAYQIVSHHHGTITAASTLGCGTTITITLPVARGGSHLV